jgi:BlaI family transcriptional regulator, penicillinase repressor
LRPKPLKTGDDENGFEVVFTPSSPNFAVRPDNGRYLRRTTPAATVRTILKRLEEKGYATHRIEGRTYVYNGCDTPRNVAANAVRQIIDRLCEGSVEQLLVGMVDNEIVDERELQRLAQQISRRRALKGES